MTKNFDSYQINMYSSIDTGRTACITFYNGISFAGRIDFLRNAILPPSYFWHPNGTSGPAQIYIVLQMSSADLENICQLLREEKPWFIYLSGTPGIGSSTNGNGGALQNSDKEPTGEQEGV